MFHPLSTLFRRTKIGWDEVDVKYFVQRYLQEKLKTQALYCEKVHDGIIVVRVATPTARQEVALVEFDLARDLHKQTNYALRQLVVYAS